MWIQFRTRIHLRISLGANPREKSIRSFGGTSLWIPRATSVGTTRWAFRGTTKGTFTGTEEVLAKPPKKLMGKLPEEILGNLTKQTCWENHCGNLKELLTLSVIAAETHGPLSRGTPGTSCGGTPSGNSGWNPCGSSGATDLVPSCEVTLVHKGDCGPLFLQVDNARIMKTICQASRTRYK